MAYVRKADRTVQNETGVEGIEKYLTNDELVYCNNLATIWKQKLEMIPGTTMVRVGTYQGLLEMGQSGQNYPTVTKVLTMLKAKELLVAQGYVITFGG